MSDNLTDRLLALESAAVVASERLTLLADVSEMRQETMVTVVDRLDGIERAIRPLREQDEWQNRADEVVKERDDALARVDTLDGVVEEATRERDEYRDLLTAVTEDRDRWQKRADEADHKAAEFYRMQVNEYGRRLAEVIKERDAWKRRATMRVTRLVSIDRTALNAPATHAEMEKAKQDEEKEWMDAATLKDDVATAPTDALPPCPLCGAPGCGSEYHAWCSADACDLNGVMSLASWNAFPRRAAILAEVRSAWDVACAQYDSAATMVFDKLLVALEAKK